MNAIQPPLDAQLLEARSAALILSVSHLALLIKNACRRKGSLEWIDQALANMEVHMKVDFWFVNTWNHLILFVREIII